MTKTNRYTLLKSIITFVVAYLFCIFPAVSQLPSANFTASPLAGCSPLFVSFQDLSSGSPTSWQWDFGNGNTSSLQNPSASYFTPGQYTVRLTVTNSSGSNTLIRTQYITVYEAPTVSFNASNTSGCFPLHVQFTDQSTAGSGNTNVSWQWDFGNGQTSTLQNPSILYTSSGTFPVTLKVINDKGCSKVLSIANYVTVAPGVRSAFSNTLPAVCRPPADITFTNNSTGPGVLNWFWDFGDGNTSVLQNPMHTYIAPGSYTVMLATTSSSGCSDTLRSAIPVVIGGITTSFNSPASVCVNAPVTFNNTSTPPPGSSNWNFGDGGTSTLTNPSHTYSTAGTYTIRLLNTYSNCNDSVSQNIIVNPLPVPDFSSLDTISCQPPLTVNFQDQSTGAVSWQWNFGDGTTSALQNPVHTYNNYGNYNVTLIVTNSFGCTDSITKNNFIKIQKATISIPSLPTHGCIPFTISPVATINALDIVTSYLWDFGDGSTSTVATPVHTYNTQGTYNVSLIITTSTGCTDTLLINNAVRVGTNPVVDFTVSPLTQCSLQPVQFTDISVPADQWLWSFGDGTISLIQNPSHIYAMPGVYTVTLVASNNGCPGTMTKNNYITVLPPVANFNFAANCSNRTEFSFTDQSTGAVSWLWDFGDGSPTSNLQNPIHNFPALGNYIVSLTVTNGTCSNTITHIIHAIDETPDFTSTATSGCKPAFSTFTATSITPSNIATYFWNFGDGFTTTTTLPSINHIYNNSGTYTVTLVTKDINGCQDTTIKINYFRVNGPIANFSAIDTSGCIGLTTIFNDLSSNDGINNIVSWQWDFGDGTVQTFNSPPFQHIYNTVGTYSVKLKVTDAAGCMDSLTKSNLIIISAPRSLFLAIDSITCPGATVMFKNNSTSIFPINSFWDFGDGASTNTIGTPTVNHNYITPGNYTVKLRINDSVGCADSLIKNLYVHVESPVASFTVSDSVSSCVPLQVQFTNTSTYYSSLFWNFNPGNSTLTNPVHYYSLPGSYSVMLVATSRGGCTDTTYKTITVYDTAGSRIDYLPISGCKPLSVNFAAFTQGPFTYLWDFGDGTSQTTNSPSTTHTYNSYGDFLPKIILQDPSGCLIPVAGADTIHLIGANAKFGFDKNLLCDSGPVNFTDSTTFNDPVISYFWNFGDGTTSSLQNPVHQYNAPGNYSVSLSVQTQSGCSDIVTLTNAIKIVQSPSIAIAGDTAACINSSLLHSGIFNFPDTSIVTWLWNFPNGNNSILQNPPVQTYSVAGNFTVSAIATNSSGCKDTAQQNIIIYPLPTVTLPGTMTIQNGFPATIPATYSANTINWVWSPSLGLSCTNCPQPIASPKFNTDYTVTFTDQNGCVNTALIHIIVICKNANLFMPNTFSPNGDGSNDIFYPRGRGLDRVKSLRIFDRWGEVVFEQNNFPVNDPLYGWNGTYKGKKPQAGVYVYQVEVYCDNGDVIKLDGNVALIL
ncbi:MAG: PKD domain-containing protein [Bacteroidetes bacterium]|nr:PKD domain-containing protein [Bacteroidota bacterium]MBS1929452.1 PKD domain-containing protein [Bacteroidota bacterium]